MTTKTFLLSLALTIAPAMSCNLFAQEKALLPKDEGPVISKVDGMTVINTSSLADDVEGYAGPTPLKIFIKKDKIEKIEPLRNLETPKYFALIKRDLLGKWNGLAVKKASSRIGLLHQKRKEIENKENILSKKAVPLRPQKCSFCLLSIF